MAIETCTPLAWAIYSVCLVSAYLEMDTVFDMNAIRNSTQFLHQTSK